MNAEGGEPNFNPAYPMTSAFATVRPGDTVVFGAKADEGWKFVGWKNTATGNILSTEEVVAVKVNEAMEIVAVFEPIKNNHNDGENQDNSGSNNTPNTTPSNDTSTPATGEAASAAALAAVTLGSLGAAVMLGKKRRNEK